MRYIVDEYERLGIEDLEDTELLQSMGLTTAIYPYYDEDVIEAIMNMFNISLEKAIKIWDNDNTRFDYYENFTYSQDKDPYVELALYRIDDLEEIEANNDYSGFTEEIITLKNLYATDHEGLKNYLINNGWKIHEFVAIGWDIEELNSFMETM